MRITTTDTREETVITLALFVLGIVGVIISVGEILK